MPRILALDADVLIVTANRHPHQAIDAIAEQAPAHGRTLKHTQAADWPHLRLAGTLILTTRIAPGGRGRRLVLVAQARPAGRGPPGPDPSGWSSRVGLTRAARHGARQRYWPCPRTADAVSGRYGRAAHLVRQELQGG